MLFIKRSRVKEATKAGFTMVELLVALVIISVIAAIAIPAYTSAKNRQYLAVAINDGDAMFREMQAVLGGVNSFGTTDGTIAYNNTTKMLTITLGLGGDSLAPVSESVSAGTTITGVTYANSKSWCMDINNKGRNAFFTQEGYRDGATSCPISGLSYSNTAFTMGSDNQLLSPTPPTGGYGTKSYAITAGTLPPGVTFDASTGVFSGPVAGAWNFKANQITSGLDYSCAITSTNGVKCWGNNAVGQLGDGTFVNRSSPVNVYGLTSGMSSVWASTSGTTCALSQTGGLKCWGLNSMGQIGDGTTTNEQIPTQVSGMTSGVTPHVGVGDTSACAVLTSGVAKCWGDNTYGQLGNGTTTASLVPTTVTGYSSGGASDITVGGKTGCLITTTSGLKCWGLSTNGQMGTGSNTRGLTPTDVVGLTSGVSKISEGIASGCALTTSGAIKCWGLNTYGQLGNGNTTQNLTPVAVTGFGSGAIAVSMGGDSACAIDGAGGGWCWGLNDNGQLGDGTTTNSNVPVAVSGLGSGLSQIATGTSHVCSLTSAQGIVCWGLDTSGQLGDGIVTQRSTPQTVTNLTVGVGNVPSFNQVCALTSTGGLKCWGNNGKGQIGNGNKQNQATPVDVVGLTSGVAQAATGLNFTCALTTSGGIKCWGDNSGGQLGNGTTTSSLTAVDVPGFTGNVKQVAAGAGFACALKADGSVWCWGDNTYGQLGNGTNVSSLTPVQVSGITTGQSIYAGLGPVACVLVTGGDVKCWGSNSNGQLGNGTTTDSNVPVQPTGLTSGVTSLSVGPKTVCAVQSAALFCFGYNANGQIGNNTTTQSLVSVATTGLSSGVVNVSVGYYHTCALLTTTGIKCWGYNGYGEVGDGTFVQRLTPVDVLGLTTGVQFVAAGQYSTCAVLLDGTARCWGLDTSGQLGIGTQTQQITQVATNGTGLQAGFPSTITVTVTDSSGSSSVTITLTVI